MGWSHVITSDISYNVLNLVALWADSQVRKDISEQDETSSSSVSPSLLVPNNTHLINMYTHRHTQSIVGHFSGYVEKKVSSFFLHSSTSVHSET